MVRSVTSPSFLAAPEMSVKKGGSDVEMHVYGSGWCKVIGRPRKTWLEVVKNDMKGLGLASADALNHFAWRRTTVGREV